MASLKEIRARILSVNSTKKITSAMKMVSAAKLHKSEENTLRFIPYKQKLTDILTQYLSNIEPGTVQIPLAEKREVKRASIVCISSNSGLCGVFNSNVNKLLNEAISKYQAQNVSVSIYPIGKKISDYVRKLGYPVTIDCNDLCDKPSYEQACTVIQPLVQQYLNQEIDELILLYNHHKNAASQIPTNEVLLPLSTEVTEPVQGLNKDNQNLLYITEPNVETVINQLVPNVIRMRFYAAIMDSTTAEHGARTTAMQVASDNASKMIETITQQYNRARQEVITNELLDIVGGSEALRN
ncbi:MAG: ATP synthase F1 subunit gamma [Paludibacteraceae bacterium]|jgi:F-type H+-transporting ATPase subunit gamma|nr:ATP synthase F1 subunit gamma [Paludibacteraceae bacterium]